jgi:threonine dehydratase
MITLADIEQAAETLRGQVVRTPATRSGTLSQQLGRDVHLKLENLQVTGSFKARGAYVKLTSLSSAERARGVIAASAGNHAQGVAYHAKRLGIAATIVMPMSTPLIKVSRTQAYGADVVLHGDGYDDAYAHAQQLAAQHNYVYVHAYDDDHVMAGQGTIGLELLEQVPDIDTVLVPVGGGGLIGGIGVALKAKRAGLRVVGVEASVMPSMQQALAAGGPVSLPAARTLAEGIAVRKVGVRNHDICRQVVDDIVTVHEADIARAILFLLESEKTVAEGAGAAAVAALLSGHEAKLGKSVVAVVCGGNIDVSVLSRIIDRGLVESGRLARFQATVPDRPGALADMLQKVAHTRGNVVEVHHERAFNDAGLGQVTVDLVVETRGHDHVAALRGLLTTAT